MWVETLQSLRMGPMGIKTAPFAASWYVSLFDRAPLSTLSVDAHLRQKLDFFNDFR